MIDRTYFPAGLFKQVTGGACMLASYGVAAQAFVATPVIEFLCAFAQVSVGDQATAELCYRIAFEALVRQPGSNGLRVIEEAHERHASPTFTAMRDTAVVAYIDRADRLVAALPALAAATRAISIVTVNTGSALIGGVTSHALTLGHDAKGWFAFDVNTGDLVPGLVQPSDLGSLGDALLLIKG